MMTNSPIFNPCLISGVRTEDLILMNQVLEKMEDGRNKTGDRTMMVKVRWDEVKVKVKVMVMMRMRVRVRLYHVEHMRTSARSTQLKRAVWYLSSRI